MVSDPAGHGFADWKHLTLHFLRVHMDASYAEIVDWANEDGSCACSLAVGPRRISGTLDAVAVVQAVPTCVWRQLLQRSATISDPGAHGALDATFFDREAASSHCRTRSNRHIRTLKTTALVDTDMCAVLDLHCSAH